MSIHPLTEGLEGRKCASLLSFRHHLVNKPSADALHRRQAESDALLYHGEVGARLIDVRRQQAKPHLLTLGDVLRHLAAGIQNTGQQGGHVLLGIVAFEIGGLIGHDGVADRVGFVEGVVGEVVDVIINLLGSILWDAIGHAPLDVPLRIAVDERLPLLLDLLGLFFRDGTAHHVCAAQRVPGQLLEDHHDLFLVDDAAVGDRQDGFQAGMQVADLAGIRICRR